jgi:polyhydroxyalkanoate synthase
MPKDPQERATPSFPVRIRPEDAAEEMAEISRKIAKGMAFLANLSEDEITIGATPKEMVYGEDKLRLYRYTPRVPHPHHRPVLISYALVNRYLVADLQEDRSLVRNLLDNGMDVYVIDWGDPAPQDKFLTVEDYVDGYLGNCVDFIRESRGLDAINLFGICQGGTFATCYAALNPEKVRTLTLTVTPIDFHAGEDRQMPELGLLFNWAQGIDVDLLVDACGNVPADGRRARRRSRDHELPAHGEMAL